MMAGLPMLALAIDRPRAPHAVAAAHCHGTADLLGNLYLHAMTVNDLALRMHGRATWPATWKILHEAILGIWNILSFLF